MWNIVNPTKNCYEYEYEYCYVQYLCSYCTHVIFGPSSHIYYSLFSFL